jgi:hypothetical protein
MGNTKGKPIARVVLDNGGNITIQLWYEGDPVGVDEFGCTDDSAADRAQDILAHLRGELALSDYEGHAPEAYNLDPSIDEIKNGCYRVVRIDGNEALAGAIKQLKETGWRNGQELAEALRTY